MNRDELTNNETDTSSTEADEQGVCRCCKRTGPASELDHESVCLGCEDRWEEARQLAAEARADYAERKGR